MEREELAYVSDVSEGDVKDLECMVYSGAATFQWNMTHSVASFLGLLSPNAVEGLVKLLRSLTSGGRLEAWLIAPCIHIHNTTVHRKCHASRRPPDVRLRRSFTRPSTALGDRKPGNEAMHSAWFT